MPLSSVNEDIDLSCKGPHRTGRECVLAFAPGSSFQAIYNKLPVLAGEEGRSHWMPSAPAKMGIEGLSPFQAHALAGARD